MKTDSLAGKAYVEIRKKILSNQVAPNERLKEDQWAKKLNVSRIAIREALTRLLGEGLVTPGEKGGFFVIGMKAEDIHQIKELRQILELGALELAIQKISPQQIRQLEKICDEFTSMVSQEYFNGACEADIKFHETLIKCAGNKKLLTAYISSHIPIFHQKLGRMQVYLDDYDLTDKEHRQVLNALKTKNLAMAKKAMTQHLARGEAAVLDMM